MEDYEDDLERLAAAGLCGGRRSSAVGDIISFFANPCLFHVQPKEMVFYWYHLFHRLDWLWVEVGGEA